MTIDGIGGDPTAAAKANQAAKRDPAVSGERSEASGSVTDRSDKVEISAEGRALSVTHGLGADRLAQIHQRLDSGAYHTSEFAERIAERLLPEIA